MLYDTRGELPTPVAVDQRFDIAVTRGGDETKPAPCVLILARDHDKGNIEGTRVGSVGNESFEEYVESTFLNGGGILTHL